MLWPNSAVKAFEKAFYTDEVILCGFTENLDKEGGVKNEMEAWNTIRANVRIIEHGGRQEESGVTERAKVRITAPNHAEPPAIGGYLMWEGMAFMVIEWIPHDSHWVAIGEDYGRD